MSRIIFRRTVLFLWLLCIGMLANAATTSVQFYSESLNIDYHSSLIIETRVLCNEASISEYYQQLQASEYRSLLNDLEKHREYLKLNDWLYFELLRMTVNKILHQKTKLQKTLTTWFLLSKSGYDTRLTYLQHEAFVYVYTRDSLFEVPMIEEQGRLYINLSSLKNSKKSYASEVFMLDFVANRNGRSFSFYMDTLPKLTSKLKKRALHFTWNNKQYAINANVDLTIIDLMKNYPIIDETKYLEIPLSTAVYRSIIPQLQKIIKGRSIKESLEILVAFTRSAFDYKEDHDYFGRSKPMIADEVFHYPYSDCEDRSALFYNLVKVLLDLPMIMIAYPDHLTIAVAMSQPIGVPIRYKGKKYYICDPTGPSNSSEIGRVPKNYQSKSFEILAAYK